VGVLSQIIGGSIPHQTRVASVQICAADSAAADGAFNGQI
jgi:hypothetical protein